MKYALVVLEIAGEVTTVRRQLESFATSIETSLVQSGAIEQLNTGAYLLNLEHGLQGLTHLSGVAKDLKLGFRTLFFEKPPAFVITKPA